MHIHLSLGSPRNLTWPGRQGGSFTSLWRRPSWDQLVMMKQDFYNKRQGEGLSGRGRHPESLEVYDYLIFFFHGGRKARKTRGK